MVHCPTCTFLNFPELRRCEMCGTALEIDDDDDVVIIDDSDHDSDGGVVVVPATAARARSEAPSLSPVAAAAAADGAAAASPKSPSTAPSGAWACAKCRSHNAASARSCWVCGGKQRPSAAVSTSKARPTDKSVVVGPSRLAATAATVPSLRDVVPPVVAAVPSRDILGEVAAKRISGRASTSPIAVSPVLPSPPKASAAMAAASTSHKSVTLPYGSATTVNGDDDAGGSGSAAWRGSDSVAMDRLTSLPSAVRAQALALVQCQLPDAVSASAHGMVEGLLNCARTSGSTLCSCHYASAGTKPGDGTCLQRRCLGRWPLAIRACRLFQLM